MKAKSDLDCKNQLKTKSMILFFLIFPLKMMLGQSTLPSTGNDITGDGGSISYTIGQTVYTTHSSTTGTLNQGIQQPFEITVISNLAGNSSITLEMTVYPIPVKDQLTLNISDNKFSDLRYYLTDIKGSILFSGEINSQITYINMSAFSPAVYVLIVKTGQKTVASFKILKK